ncbi:Uncharacterised protein [Mycobacteroides abscessus subsp. abscessus]|nr:Uncharacterised protein [Mycobacteroides abscessus subsp. abscessus]
MDLDDDDLGGTEPGHPQGVLGLTDRLVGGQAHRQAPGGQLLPQPREVLDPGHGLFEVLETEPGEGLGGVERLGEGVLRVRIEAQLDVGAESAQLAQAGEVLRQGGDPVLRDLRLDRAHRTEAGEDRLDLGDGTGGKGRVDRDGRTGGGTAGFGRGRSRGRRGGTRARLPREGAVLP